MANIAEHLMPEYVPEPRKRNWAAILRRMKAPATEPTEQHVEADVETKTEETDNE